MPKMKTKSAAKKRFAKNKNKKVKFSHGYRRHILTKKSSKRKRQLRGPAFMCDADAKRVLRLLPN